MQSKVNYVIFICVAAFITACKSGELTKVSATGSVYECLVVMNNHPLSTPEHIISPSAYTEDINTTYDLVKATLSADMPAMPQVETYFLLSQVSPHRFDDFLKPTRNILIVDIDEHRYTQVKQKRSRDYWSHPQALCRIQAPSDSAFITYWREHGTAIRTWFVNEEIDRQAAFYRASTNKTARLILKQRIGADMLIPEDYMLLRDTVIGDTTFLWCCNNKGPMRRDVVVYSYPYTDTKTFNLEFLNATRDAIMRQMVTATINGSYMGTEYNIMPPQMRLLTIHDVPKVAVDSALMATFWGAEIRGLWKMYNGEAMGGPYVSLTRIDPLRARVVTAEAFIFAPGQKKRTALRQAESILYTLNFNK